MVEIFVNGGKYCISRQLHEKNVKGNHLALTSLGGTAKLISLEAWKLKTTSVSKKTRLSHRSLL
jgi:sucrose-6-phosphate hydrolase SacC (GH32 family)